MTQQLSLAARLLTLRVELRDEDAAAEVTPARLAAYLAAAGWTHEASTTHWHIWTRAGVLVKAPIDGDWSDHGMVMLEVIRDAAAAEGRSPLAVWVELVGLAPQEPAGEAQVAPDGPEPIQAAPEPATGVQERLPGFAEASAPRRSTRHVFGGFELREYPAGPLAPAATVTALTRSCGHCLCLHRITSSGPRLGAEDLYSTDGGETWTTKSPPCHTKRPRETR